MLGGKQRCPGASPAPSNNTAEVERDGHFVVSISRLCHLASLSVHTGEAPDWTTNLAEMLRDHEQIRDIYAEQARIAMEPEWWLTLTEEQQETLNAEADHRCICVITSEVMRNPAVLSSSGETYECLAIQAWMQRPGAVDPQTNLSIGSGATLTTNAQLMAA